jgi:purine-binding chemotaxis protein CheW
MKTGPALVEVIEFEEVDNHKYLLFKLNEELYATPLLAVKQVIEFQSVKSVPNTVPYFIGLINYRGQIIGLVDLKKRFQMPENENVDKTFLIFESEGGSIAAQVDFVDAVISLADEKIEKNPNIKSKVPESYMLGVAHYNDQMITLIDLSKSFSSEEYVQIVSNKLMTG